MIHDIEEALKALAIEEKARFLPHFFKTGKGEYGEGDLFLGVTVPDQRQIAKAYYNKVSLNDLSVLLQNPYHEMRLTALLILVLKYEKTKLKDERNELVQFYLNNLPFVNNWDLVDTTAYKILGRHCYEIDDTRPMYQLADSQVMWEQRIAVVATLHFIKKKIYEPTCEIVLQNLTHSHDLMHKANGWMLREMGKQNEEILISFLEKYAHQMPRTTLRYAIEKLDTSQKALFMNKTKADFQE